MIYRHLDVRTDVPCKDDFLRTKISLMHRLPNFLTHGAPLRACLGGGGGRAVKTPFFNQKINTY